jgi:hypothetical protein
LLTHDELIAAGIWSGETLAVRARMADYSINSNRFGAMHLRTKSGSPNDVHLDKRTSEVVTAAMVLARAGFERVGLISLDVYGNPLESPDLDARLPDGRCVGLEVAEVISTDAGKHSASRNAVEVIVGDFVDNDPAFASAFGSYYFSMTLNGAGPQAAVKIGSKKEMQAIADEVVRYIRSGDHRLSTTAYFRAFPPDCKTLSAMGAEFHSEPIETGPYFSLNEGASTIGRVDDSAEVLRILNKHRVQAAKYRPGPIWMILFLTDAMEFFNNTIGAIAMMKPRVDPFEIAYLMDATARLLVLPEEHLA